MNQPKTYTFTEFPYQQMEEQRSGVKSRRAVIVVGAGPIGLTSAIGLAVQGVPVLVLDDNNTVSIGSRGLCYAKRPLEIWDRLGCAKSMLEMGVSWKIGKVFRDSELVYQFDLLPEEGHKMPAFINLQQYYLEEYLLDRCSELAGLIDLRWKHRVVGVRQDADGVALQVETQDGVFALECDWLIACDGANSGIREMLGAEFKGRFFQDRFLIADVLMKADLPTERRFWFDPPFHRNQSVLLHRQAASIWRIDFQLGWEADPAEERKPERVLERLHAMFGEETEFELEWVSVYQFACRRLEHFRHGRVLFAGDSAHQVSPFGARGANTGAEDADNLAWKLKLVLEGHAPQRLLDSYDEERVYAADDNVLISSRSADFMTPKSTVSRAFRDATLRLARDHAFARPLVNSGRLSTPTPYVNSSLNTADDTAFAGKMYPGAPATDAPIRIDGSDAWLIERLGGRFVLLCFGDAGETRQLQFEGIACDVLAVGRDFEDHQAKVAERYDGSAGTTYLVRPDQYIAARWRQFDRAKIAAAVARATCNA